jgi:glutamyl-tRNA(Gln) amidotransferase subunit D
VIKLDSGYNVGVAPGSCSFAERPPAAPPKSSAVVQEEGLPKLSIVSTGGTIASRVDYRTGSVTSRFDAKDILVAIPELARIGNFRAHALATILSENMTPEIWQQLAWAVCDEINSGAEGVIVTHGTDTMAYSAAALSFMIESPAPIVFVGSQRSADRPSSDNAINAACAAKAAASDLGEVAVVMHGSTNDDACSIHRGTRVRKMHTSRRDAFRSIGIPPLGTISYPSLEVKLADHAVRRSKGKAILKEAIDTNCGLLFFHPGMSPDLLRAYEGYSGLVIFGTGLGHVHTSLIPALEKLTESGTVIAMISQCMGGRVCDRVYDTGRDLLAAGVIEGGDMLPEAALVKMMWVLGNEKRPEKAKALLQANLKGEITERSLHGL